MIQAISPQQAAELIAGGDVDVVDVREPGEWAQGHLAAARLVPLGQFRASPAASLARDGVIFVCAAGVRSQTAARLAEGLGYKRLYNLTGGTRAWTAARLPLIRDSEPPRPVSQADRRPETELE
jgi:sulfur-carrier protein adenylyltransferase/sulfurtransferase